MPQDLPTGDFTWFENISKKNYNEDKLLGI